MDLHSLPGMNKNYNVTGSIGFIFIRRTIMYAKYTMIPSNERKISRSTLLFSLINVEQIYRTVIVK
jgi:hypothetical protein